tara:strand:+ start:963 stop:1283 length:321 start_codon:yes stop_codon:yes gene_type:complete
MESNSESPIIIQMLKNVKNIIEISKGRNCWEEDELKNIDITYHNVCEIVRQLQEKRTQEKQTQEKQTQEKQTQERDKKDEQNEKLDESVEVQKSEEQSDEEMEDVD